MDFLASLQQELSQKKGLYLRVKVHPGATTSQFKEPLADGTLKVDIAAPPEGGKANQALIKFLAASLAVEKGNIKILSGAGERIKLVKISL